MIDPLKTNDPVTAVYENLGEYYQSLYSKDKSLSIRDARGWKNRKKWRRGFSQCRVCKSKLMYELGKGEGFDRICEVLHEKHPKIKNIRKYAQNVIRETTGDGIFDDYIVKEQLWYVRKPILAPPEIRKQLEILWLFLRHEGESRVEIEKTIIKHLEKKTKTGQLISYAMGGVSRKRGVT